MTKIIIHLHLICYCEILFQNGSFDADLCDPMVLPTCSGELGLALCYNIWDTYRPPGLALAGGSRCTPS